MNKLYNIQNEVGTIFLYGRIGYNAEKGDGIDGNHVAQAISFLDEYEECKEVNIHINSGGGSVMDGMSIYSAMNKCKKTVNTYVDGVAGSIAGVIAVSGKKRYISDFGKIMIHNPFIPDNELNEQEKESVEQMRDSILTMLENNSKLSRNEMEQVMNRETWYKANDALSAGLVDEIVSTKRDFKDVESISNDALMSIMNEAIYKPKIDIQMKKVLNFLSLEENATEEVVLDKVKNQVTELDNIKNELNEKQTALEAKETELEAIKNDLKAERRKVLVAKIDNAIENGVFNKDKKVELIEKFENNVEALDLAISSIGIKPVKVMNHVQPSEEKENLRQLEKSNPEKVEKIKNEQPELYAVMFKEAYGVEFKK